MKKLFLVALSVSLPYSVYAAPVNNNVIGSEAGAQLMQTQDYLERERIERELAEARKKRSQVEGEQTTKGTELEGEVSFLLSSVDIPVSQILKPEDVSAVTAEYIGKEVTISKLKEMVTRINELYANAGFVTSRAYLPEQTVRGGVVKVALVEAKTGTVDVVNNKNTTSAYIRSRISLHPGRYDNIDEVNSDLLRFNATNDAQIRIQMQAGKEPGTTDYVIGIAEPQRNFFTLLANNSGSESSGEWRYGLYWSSRSLTGTRDSLTVGTMRSRGNKSYNLNYSIPVGRSGTRFSVGYAANDVKMVTPLMRLLDARGDSSSVSVGVLQPLVTAERTRTEMILDYSHQRSKTKFFNTPWVDDLVNELTLSYNVTHYGDSHIWYHHHALGFGMAKDIDGVRQDFFRYNVLAYYRRPYQSGQMLSFRFAGQWSAREQLIPSRQHFMGGAMSVRGYKESILSGDSGADFSLEYAVPLIKKDTKAFIFLDAGRVFGTQGEKNLLGYGFGVRSTPTKNIFFQAALGFPGKREINGVKQDKMRFHLSFSWQF